MHLRAVAFLALSIPALVACAGATTSSPSPSPTQSATPAATAVAQVIEVSLTDTLRIEPSAMTVAAGRPVTFVVTNVGALEHEFFLGDEAAQAEHEAEMDSMGGSMAHDEENGIAVEPGDTKELTFTFASPGEWLAGCHVTGHYAGGMKATITITE